MNIDITKKYTTRNGMPVRIYATDGAGDQPIHGAILQDGRWFSLLWAPNGMSNKLDPQYDLVTLVEAKRTRDCDLETRFIHHYVRVEE